MTACIVRDVENLALKLACGINALCGIECSMREGPNSPECYLDGLWYICGELSNYAKQLQEITQEIVEKEGSHIPADQSERI